MREGVREGVWDGGAGKVEGESRARACSLREAHPENLHCGAAYVDLRCGVAASGFLM